MIIHNAAVKLTRNPRRKKTKRIALNRQASSSAHVCIYRRLQLRTLCQFTLLNKLSISPLHFEKLLQTDARQCP